MFQKRQSSKRTLDAIFRQLFSPQKLGVFCDFYTKMDFIYYWFVKSYILLQQVVLTLKCDFFHVVSLMKIDDGEILQRHPLRQLNRL